MNSIAKIERFWVKCARMQSVDSKRREGTGDYWRSLVVRKGKGNVSCDVSCETRRRKSVMTVDFLMYIVMMFAYSVNEKTCL